jgi:type IV pilus assembly protein PilP
VTTRPLAGTVIVLLALGAGLAPRAARAQAPPQPAAKPPVVAPPAARRPAQALPTESYSYDPAGRRDPFVSLLNRGGDMRGPGSRPEGVAGLLINDVTVRGIVESRDRFVAMLQAPDNRTYIVHINDRLFDGSIKAITMDAIVFSQEVNDPLSLVKQREVHKLIRPLQEGK